MVLFYQVVLLKINCSLFIKEFYQEGETGEEAHDAIRIKMTR